MRANAAGKWLLAALCVWGSVLQAGSQTSDANRRARTGANSASSSSRAMTAGPITLAVDATDAPRKLFHARMTIPASAGPMTLVYPKWIPGEHGPTGPIADLSGVKFSSGGKSIPWRRDDVEMFAFHITVPAGTQNIEAAVDFLSPPSAGGFSAGVSASGTLAVISWNQFVLYPEGAASDNVTFKASIELPKGWKFGTALPIAGQNGDSVDFKPVSLTTLVDSPLLTGEHFRRIELGGQPAHYLDMAADSEAALDVPPEVVGYYKNLIAETGALYGARHYTQYHFLLTLSDYVAHFGLEHHESSDDRIAERSMVEDGERIRSASLLPHEMTHSWNGKYRRPAGLATANYQEPMRGELLWVYEGLTEYLGAILTARSSLWTKENFRDDLASLAAQLDNRPGRTWRNLQDTAVDAQVLYNTGGPWDSARRGVDFYPEGELVWLEVDTMIRQQTQGKKSLNDFCKHFHGGQSGPPKVVTYTFDDIVAELNAVSPYDWRRHLTERLTSLSPHAPLGGIENSGWKLVYTDTPSDLSKSVEGARGGMDASYSLGVAIRRGGAIGDVASGTPAFAAGIGPGMRLVAVNGRTYSPDVLRDALKAGKANSSAPLELLIENNDHYATYKVDYHGGERYPHLERDAGKPDMLEQILAPMVAQPSAPK